MKVFVVIEYLGLMAGGALVFIGCPLFVLFVDISFDTTITPVKLPHPHFLYWEVFAQHSLEICPVSQMS